MAEGDIGAMLRATLIVVLKLGGPPLGAALVVGLVMSLVQAVTQVHEQTVAFVPKVAAVIAALVVGGPFMQATLTDFTRMLFDRVIRCRRAMRRGDRGHGAVTAADAVLVANLPGWAFAFVLVLCRTGAACMLIPGSGEAEVPMMLRAGFAAAITALLLPVLVSDLPPAPNEPWRCAAMVVAELVNGLFLGWLARLVVIGLSVAGQMLAIVSGHASVLQPDSVLGTQTAAIARMLVMGAPVLIFATGLYAMPLAAIAASYRVIPAGVLLPVGDTTQTVVTAVGASFALSLRLAAPFVLASIVWHVALALLGRLVPNLQVFFLAAPAQLLGGLALLAALAASLLAAWQEQAAVSFRLLPGL